MHYLLITSLIWAFSFGLIGNVLQGLDPIMIAGARLTIALLAFLPLLRPKQISPGERFHLVAIGAVQFGTMYVCYITAFRFIPSHLVALFSVLTPVYVVLIHDIIHKRFHTRYLFAALLSMAGASVIKARGSEYDSIWVGFVIMQFSGIAFAFGQVAYRDWKLERKNIKDHEIFGFLYAGGAAAALLASFLMAQEPGEFLGASGTQISVIFYLGIIASGLGFFLWNKGATLCSAGVLAAFNNAVVPMAMFVSLFVFGEIGDAPVADLYRLLLGSALIAGAVLIGKQSKRA